MRETVRYSLAHRAEALAYAMSFARGMDPRIADRFVGMWVNDMTVDCGERGRRAVQELLDRGHAAGRDPRRACASSSWTPDVALRWAPPNPFPAHSLPDLEGVQRPLATAWSEGPALVLIGHRDCATTRLTLPFVDRIHQRRPAGASVIAVLQDDAGGRARAVADLGLDHARAAGGRSLPARRRARASRAVPTLMLVGTDGRIVSGRGGLLARRPRGVRARRSGSRRRSSRPTTRRPPRRPG